MVIFYYSDVRLNEKMILKYLKLDNELDASEEVIVQQKIKKLAEIRKLIKTDTKLGIFC
jgi:hypothetical protein